MFIFTTITSEVFIPHSQVILVKRGRLGGIADMRLLLLWESSVSAMYVYPSVMSIYLYTTVNLIGLAV
jgi:hypothetical protein